MQYLCKDCRVQKQTATVGLQHCHILLYRWEPFAAQACKEVLHLQQSNNPIILIIMIFTLPS